MLQKRTVLVLGAGSSVEFNLPAGPALANTIATKVAFYVDGGRIVEGDEQLFGSLRSTFRDDSLVPAYLAAGQLMSRGLPLARSIDDFLYIHGANEAVVHVGKAAIVTAILEAERRSSLWTQYALKNRHREAAFHQLADTWLYKLFGHLWSNIRFAEIQRLFDGLTIINFNYDRCVEHFFVDALQIAYSIDAPTAAEVVSKLDIVHPYGQVGRLPWQSGAGPGVSFGADHYDAASIASGIKTFTEQSHDPEEVEGWRQRLRQAEQIIFLGFAFHPQNVELLQPGVRPKPPWPRVYATAFKTSSADQAVFESGIQEIRGRPPAVYSSPTIVEVTCAQFIRDFGLAITS